MNQLNYILFTSQEAKFLFEKLRFNLSQKEGLFRKLLIVPSGFMQHQLYKKLLQDKVVTGFKVLELPVAIDYLIHLISFQDKKSHTFPTGLLLSMHIETLLRKQIEAQKIKQDELFEPLIHYLSDPISHKTQKKIQELSETLSRQFIEYGLYGGKALKTWLQNKSWQTELWHELFTTWDYPYKLFQQEQVLNTFQLHLEIHLFGFTHIPFIYEEFFQKLPSSFQFYEYYLNPCAHFWGDICSEKERFFLGKRYAKEAVSQNELVELEGYLKERNLFLANFGKLTQKRFNILVDREYAAADLELEQEDSHPSLLNAIKQDIICWNKGAHTIHEQDASLQVLEIPSKKREIEVLFTHLMDLTHRCDIKPSDILVLAPNISEYFPFIYQVFHEKTPFAIEVHDLEMISQHPFLQGFWEILCLKEKRWELKDIFKLLMIEPLLDRYKWTQKEVSLIKKWCETSHIMWGFNKQHREEILCVPGGVENKEESNEVGTWSYGLERLLFGLTTVQPEEVSLDDTERYYPIEGAEMLHAELLGDFIHLLENLYADMQFFSKAVLSISEWVNYCKKLAEKYFLIEDKDSTYQHSKNFFFDQLKTLLLLSHRAGEAKYPFSSIKRFFQKTLCKKGAVFASPNKDAICFASLKPHQIYPAKVIWLLGMEEGAFPRLFEKSPLRELEEKNMDYAPSLIEEDRQIILDTILYAENYVRFSYVSIDPQDGKNKSVCFLVEELLEFIKKHYPSARNVKHTYKSLSFHQEEINGQYGVINFSQRNYRLGCSLYHLKQEPSLLIPEFYKKREKQLVISKEKEEKISLKELKIFARNPLQHYFNHTLGLYIRKQIEEEERAKREFVFSSLDKALFRIENLSKEFQTTYNKLDKVGALPAGIFKEIARDQLQEEKEEFLERFKNLGMNPLEMMTIELSSACTKPIQKKEGYWLVPHLEIEINSEEKVYIEGVLEYVSPQGLTFYGKSCIQDYVKFWPIYLVFHQIVLRDFSSQVAPQLLFLKDGSSKHFSSSVDEHLINYLNYYRKAKETPSLFFPSWAEALLSESIEETAQIIKDSFASRKELHTKFLDEYQKWFFEHLKPFCPHAVHDLWAEDFRTTFAPMMLWHEGEKNA